MVDQLKTILQINKRLPIEFCKNIVVYDSSRGISRLIKNKIEGEFNVTIINSKGGLKNHKFTNSYIVFYIVNDAIDALPFPNVYFNAELVFLGITTKNLEQHFISYTDVIRLDLQVPKKELIDSIQYHLQTK